MILLQTGRPYAWTPSVETAVREPEPPPYDRFKLTWKEGHLEGAGDDYWGDIVHEEETIKQVYVWNETFVINVRAPLSTSELFVFKGSP